MLAGGAGLRACVICCIVLAMRKPLHHHFYDYFFPHPRNNHRPNLFSAVSVAVLVLAVVIFEAGYLVQTKIVFLKTDFLASVLPGALVILTNQDRSASGLAGVIEDALLNKAAQAAAEDMSTKGYFAHVSPDGKSPWYWLDQVGYSYSYAGENLAVNFVDSSSVEMAWMNSPTHRANIEKPQYTRIGIGVASGMYEGKETTFVVQFFATPAAKQVAPAKVALVNPTVSEPAVATPAAFTQVLGSETSVPVASAAPTKEMGWFVSLLASPLNTLMTVLATLFVLITISFMIAVLARGKVQHPSVIVGGALLLVVISGAILVGAGFAGSVQLPVEGQAVSAQGTLPN